MAKLPLIEIRPANTGFWNRQAFVDASTACDFMIGKKWRDWKLYIHGRLYNWSQDKGSVERHVLKNHIMNCIDNDIAFYGRD